MGWGGGFAVGGGGRIWVVILGGFPGWGGGVIIGIFAVGRYFL